MCEFKAGKIHLPGQYFPLLSFRNQWHFIRASKHKHIFKRITRKTRMCLKSLLSRAHIRPTGFFGVTWITQSFYYVAVRNKSIQWFSAQRHRHVSPHFPMKSLLIMSDRLLGLEREEEEFCVTTAHLQRFQPLYLDPFLSQLEGQSRLTCRSQTDISEEV